MASCHVRSISLPSRSHPLTLSIEDQLCNLKASQSSSVCHKLAGLKDLHECFDDFLQLPLTQQNLSGNGKSECVEEILNGSLRFLDLCSNTRDVFSQAKESLQELESSLRRKKNIESREIDEYMAARKNLNKDISKYLKNLKRKEKNLTSSSSEEINILRNVEGISVAMFEDIMSFISPPKSRKSYVYSIVSKLTQSKRVSCETNAQVSEVQKIDVELLVLKTSKVNDVVQVQNVHKGLKALVSSIQEMEEELECVYRRLVKSRVSLLNVLNHWLDCRCKFTRRNFCRLQSVQ